MAPLSSSRPHPEGASEEAPAPAAGGPYRPWALALPKADATPTRALGLVRNVDGPGREEVHACAQLLCSLRLCRSLQHHAPPRPQESVWTRVAWAQMGRKLPPCVANPGQNCSTKMPIAPVRAGVWARQVDDPPCVGQDALWNDSRCRYTITLFWLGD